jgi:hypothetical protein
VNHSENIILKPMAFMVHPQNLKLGGKIGTIGVLEISFLIAS